MFGYKPETSNRQPVVLYDKDNKAIDVSGIEELSSVKIDTGKIAGDLELVKDNQGRLYGEYEETWIPVKVDSEGRPIISSEEFAQDVTVQGIKSELEDVKSELVLVKNGIETLKENQTSGDQKVQLSGTIAELQTDLLATIAYNTGMSGIKVSSWANVQHIVRAGIADKVFSIGDQFIAEFNGTPAVWDVIGINHDIPSDKRFTHSLTIQAHDCLLNAQFSAPQALYYAETSLPAGEHRFTSNGVQYSFTTSQVVPAGGQVFISDWETGYVPTTITTYAADRTTAVEADLVVTQSAGSDTLAPVNHHERCRYGSNNYAESGIRQWLNSEASTFEWVSKTNYDRPPSYGGGGFLHRLDPELAAVIGPVDKQVARNTVTDGGGQDTFKDKVFLLSRVEVYAGSEGTTTGEEVYPFYEAMASSATSGEIEERIKYLGASARTWWLRSPNTGNSNGVRNVHTAGQLSSYYARHANAAAPACCIW